METREQILEKRKKFTGAFLQLSKKGQLDTLQKLSAPFIQAGAISENVKSLDEIFVLQDKAIEAENEVKKLISKQKGYSHLTPKKNKRR